MDTPSTYAQPNQTSKIHPTFNRRGVFAGYAAAACLGAMVAAGGSLAIAQTRSQPGTPSEAPRQNPARENRDTRDTTLPRDEDGNPQFQRDGDNNTDGKRVQQDRELPSRTRGAYARPFAFQSPDMESRFNESSRRLVQMERRMRESNERLTKRLGEIRSLSAERQNAALYDLLQDMLQSNADINEYLVQSRTAWTGDIDMPNDASQPGTQRETDIEDQRPERQPNPRESDTREPPMRQDPNRTPATR